MSRKEGIGFCMMSLTIHTVIELELPIIQHRPQFSKRDNVYEFTGATELLVLR